MLRLFDQASYVQTIQDFFSSHPEAQIIRSGIYPLHQENRSLK